MFISPAQVIVVVASCQPIRADMELTSASGPSLYHGTLPLVLLVAPARDFS